MEVGIEIRINIQGKLFYLLNGEQGIGIVNFYREFLRNESRVTRVIVDLNKRFEQRNFYSLL